MRIAVCMKQVPAAGEGTMDPKTGTIRRESVSPVVNRYDLSALEAALRLRETEKELTVDVFTMGPKRAEDLLRTAYAMGADHGYLLCDSAFGGADVLATSYTLSQAFRAVEPYDLILCGRQTTDGDTAQVSGALAQWLELPHANWAEELVRLETDSVQITVSDETHRCGLQLPLPCLLSVEREKYLPRMPSLKLKMAARKKPVTVLTLTDMPDTDPAHYGQCGSATRVRKIYMPPSIPQQAVLEGSAEQAADEIMRIWRGVV